MLIADRKIFFLFYFLLRYLLFFLFCFLLRYLPEMESRTQGSRPRPRTQKKSEAKDSLSEDRHFRGQGQECSRPRTKDTSASVLQKKKKGLHKNFSGDSKKDKKIGLDKNFSSDLHKKAFSKKFFKRFTKFLQFKK